MTAPNPPKPITIRRPPHGPWIVRARINPQWRQETCWNSWDEAIAEAARAAYRMRGVVQ